MKNAIRIYKMQSTAKFIYYIGKGKIETLKK